MNIRIKLSTPTNGLTVLDRVEIDGKNILVNDHHISSNRVCVHLDHPQIKSVSFENS